MADGSLAHARHAQVLAQRRGQFDIEIVQRHDAVDRAGARQVADRLDRVRAIPLVVLVRHVKDLVDALQRPLRLVLQALGGEQHDRAALPLGTRAGIRGPSRNWRDTESSSWLSHFLPRGAETNIAALRRSAPPTRAHCGPRPTPRCNRRSTPSRQPFSISASRSNFRSAIACCGRVAFVRPRIQPDARPRRRICRPVPSPE